MQDFFSDEPVQEPERHRHQNHRGKGELPPSSGSPDGYSFSYLAGMVKVEVDNIRRRYKQLGREADALKKFNFDAREEIYAMQNFCDSKDQELELVREEMRELHEYKMALTQQNAALSTRYMELELQYEENCEKLQTALEQRNEELEKLKLERLDTVEQFATLRQEKDAKLEELAQLYEKIGYSAKAQEQANAQLIEKLGSLEHQIEMERQQHEEERKRLQTALEEQQLKYKKDIDDREEILAICRQQKAEVEQAKDSIISELKQKIKSVENAIEQPVRSVQPLREHYETKSTITSNEVAIVGRINSQSDDVILLGDTEPSARKENKVPDADHHRSQNSHHSQSIDYQQKKSHKPHSVFQQPAVRPRRKQPPPRYLPSEHDFSTDEDDCVAWQPKTAPTTSNKKDVVPSSKNKPKPTNTTRKRRHSTDDFSFFVPPTSSSDSFERLKMSK